SEGPQGKNGQGENELAVGRLSGGDQRQMEPQHTELLRPRSPGRDPAQMGWRPRQRSHRHGPGKTDQGGGGERKKVAAVSPVPSHGMASTGPRPNSCSAGSLR